MKHSNRVLDRSLVGCIALFALLQGTTIAQVASDSGKAAAEPTKPASEVRTAAAASSEEKTIVLSPFMVDASRDTGFAAASALTGGRLATDLKDTPVAYQVLTHEFLEALGINDIVQAAKWGVNVSQVPDDGRQVQQGGAYGFVFQTNFRGVANDQAMINFFPTYFDADMYNIERIDLSYGPNAILFGAGAQGGRVNGLYKSAQLGKQFADLKLTLGSWDYYRATLDFNEPLTKNLAVRGNLLWQNNDTWRQREWYKRRSGSLHLTYQPWEKGRIQAIAEAGTIRYNLGVSTLGDRFTGWDGVTTYSGRVTTTATSTGTTLLSNGSRYFVWSPGLEGGAIVNWANFATTVCGGSSVGSTKIGGHAIVGPSINMDQNPILYTNGLPADFLTLANTNSQFRTPSRDFTTTYDGEPYRNKYSNVLLSMDQQVGDHLFLLAAGDVSSSNRAVNYTVVRSMLDIGIDVNRLLPTGETNPNFLQPYVESSEDMDTVNTWSHMFRTSAALVYDHTRWGDFHANVEAGYLNYKTTRQKYRTCVIDPGADMRNWGDQMVMYRYYFNVPARPHPSLDNDTVIDPVAGTSLVSHVGYCLDEGRETQSVLTRNVFKYYQAAASAKLLNDHLDLLLCARRDIWSTQTYFTAYHRDLPAGWNGTDLIYKPAPPANLFSLMYTPKSTAGVATGPSQVAASRPRDSKGFPLAQYANDVFQDDFSGPKLTGITNTCSVGGVYHILPWVSAFINRSQTWSPPGSQQRIDGSTFIPTVSTGMDGGLRFSFLHDRLTFSATRYGSNLKNIAVSTGTGGSVAYSLPNAINAIISTNVLGDLSVSDINNRGVPLLIAGSYYDTATRKNQGWEFETVFNPLQGWRLTANFAMADAKQGDAYADTRAYVPANMAVFKQILADAGVTVDSSNVATVNAGVTTANSPDCVNAANAWNQLMVDMANLTPVWQDVTRLAKVTANLFTDYTIQSGPLKAARFGAGVNYRGREVIGFRGGDTIVDPTNSTKAIDDPTVDALTPVYRPAYYTATVVLGYTRTIYNRPVRFDLVVENALNNRDPQYYNTVTRPPNGDVTNPSRVSVPCQYYYLTPLSFRFSVNVAF